MSLPLRPWLSLVLLVLVSTGCCRSSNPAPVVVPKLERCLLQPPPTPPTTIHLSGPDDGCPAGWEACLDPASAGSLALYLDALQKWARDAMLACGPLDKEPTP